jgi:hypothetical protein
MSLHQLNRQAPKPHAHVQGELCPLCEQPIAQDIARRIEARVRERHQEAIKQARAETAAASEQAVAAARAEAKAQADAAAMAKLADIQAHLTQAEQARAETAAASEQAVAAARAEAKAQADAAAMAKLADIQARLAQAEQARSDAASEIAALKAEQQAAMEKRVGEIQEGLQRQKEDLQREKEAAVLAEKAKVLKLTSELADLQRKLEGKSAHELGEGSEIDLFEQLRAAFEGDRIQRVPKGVNGADVIHEVVHNGRTCGKIVYDAKNRDAWQNGFAVKLNADKLAQGADHAILSSNKFPKDRREIHLQDGVIVAAPARVPAIVEILRDQLIRLHELRVSNQQRDSKTEEIYAFITSEHCKQLIGQVEAQAGKMLDLDTKEQEAHRRLWDQRKKLIHAVQKARGDLAFEIDRIIGTAGNGPDDAVA